MVNILTGDRDHLTKYLAEHQVLCVLDYFFSLTPSSIVTIRTFFGVKNKLKKSYFFLVARLLPPHPSLSGQATKNRTFFRGFPKQI